MSWGWLCVLGRLWNRTLTGLKTGHYMLNEFGARGGQGSVRRWGRLRGLGWWVGGVELRRERLGLFGFGGRRESVVVVGFDGIADGFAPVVGLEGLTIFVLGDVDGLHESLEQVGDGVGGFGFCIAADNGGDEACQGSAEIASGEIVAGEEVGEVFAEFLCGAGAVFFLGVVETEMQVIADARSATTSAVRESKRTQGHAVLWTERGHKKSP